MTEAEWQAADNPERMLEAIRGRTTDRKCRCFFVACLSVMLPFLYDERSKRALSELDRIVAGKCSLNELHGAWQEALAALNSFLDDPSEQRWHYVSVYAADGVALALHPHPADNIAGVAARCCHALAAAGDVEVKDTTQAKERQRQVHLLHDIFGSHYQPVAFDPSWLAWNDGTAAKIAQSIYDELAFDRRSVLADALEEAGCNNSNILNHLREPGPHVRGCWVLDFLLGKSDHPLGSGERSDGSQRTE